MSTPTSTARFVSGINYAPFTSVADALAQYNANLSWQTSIASATAALEAVRYLLINRAQKFDDRGQQMMFESLNTEKTALETFLGAKTPRAFGRSRTVRQRFAGRDVVQ